MSDLRIAYLTPSVSRAAGGIFEVEKRLAQTLAKMPGVHLEVFGTKDEFTRTDTAAWHPINVQTFPSYGPCSFGWSPQLRRAFMSAKADIAHLHVLWMYTSLIMRGWSRGHGRPFVTTLHGMLDPWALRNSRWKKRLAAWAYERNCLAQAACVQVFSEAELASARAFGLRSTLCVIPNGVDIPGESTARAPWSELLPGGEKILLYLGRLHPKKGLVNLLGAWKKLRTKSHLAQQEWRLAIAGWSQLHHDTELKSLAAEYGIESDLIFLGPLYGEAKSAAYRAADGIVLPSFSEGLPMAILEAWSYRKPVLMTPQCNLSEGFAIGAAIESQPDTDSLALGLAQLFEASDEERIRMGGCGWDLVNRKFTWPRVADEMHSVYRWLVGGGPLPTCVVQH